MEKQFQVARRKLQLSDGLVPDGTRHDYGTRALGNTRDIAAVRTLTGLLLGAALTLSLMGLGAGNRT